MQILPPDQGPLDEIGAGKYKKNKPGSCGMPAPPFDVEIQNPNGFPVKLGETGEIVIIICGNLRDYIKKPEYQRDVFIQINL